MATQPAILGSARLNNVRLDYVPAALAPIRATRVGIWLGGVWINPRVRIGSLRIQDILNDAPNTCALTVEGAPRPAVTERLTVTLNSDDPVILFTGTLQTVAISYEGRPTQIAYPCAAIDDTALANRRRPFGAWTLTSATDIAIALVETYAPSLSTAGIEADLPRVDVSLDGTEGMSGAFQQLAKLIGGYFKFENDTAYLFTVFPTDDPPDPIDDTHPFLNDPPITSSQDVSQLRTRVYGRGHGEPVLADIEAGETILPIADAVMFGTVAPGGRAIAGTTPDGGQSQPIMYASVQQGGGGSLVGPGAAPSTAPTLTAASGTSLTAGTYQAAYTWVTATGETRTSPTAAVTVGDVPDPVPGDAPNLVNDLSHWTTQGYGVIGDTIQVGITFSGDYGVNHSGIVAGASAVVTAWAGGGGQQAVQNWSLTLASAPPPIVKYISVWYRINGGPWHEHTRVGPGNQAPLLLGNYTYFGMPLPAPSPAMRSIAISGLAVGPAAVTSRKYYRTVVNGAQLKLHTTLANNTSTTLPNDTTADGVLGANAPSGDTSGLTQPTGQVNAGSTSLLLASAGPFFTTGGWTVTGIRYAGISGNTLTGIPASGSGAILTTLPYGAQILPAPSLVGVSGLTLPMQKGAPVSIWVQLDDLDAQAIQAARDLENGVVPADGIYEGPPVIDERRGEASLGALCQATLQLFRAPIQTVRYATRDTNTRSGKPITVTLASPPIAADLVIQDVAISEIDIVPGLAPRFDVTASTTRFSLDNLLRQLTKLLGGQ
jgi:hypothetical protein